MKIIWTSHADERVREWHRKKGVTHELVEEVLREPEQVVSGDLNTLVAQNGGKPGFSAYRSLKCRKGGKY